jgi:hypothetical protein
VHCVNADLGGSTLHDGQRLFEKASSSGTAADGGGAAAAHKPVVQLVRRVGQRLDAACNTRPIIGRSFQRPPHNFLICSAR